MNKKVPQLSTDNKMHSVHQQEVDPEKIIDLGTRFPVLRTPIASDVLSAKNITLRWGEHYSGLADNHLRISLQHREGLQRFLSVLKQLEC